LDPTIGSLIEESNVIKSKFNGRHKTAFLARLVLRSATWHIWKKRTQESFNSNQGIRLLYSGNYMKIFRPF